MNIEIGEKIGRLKIMDEIRVIKNNRTRIYYTCKCDCGNIKDISKYSLEKSSTLSCGCLRKKKMTKHGLHSHELYNIWDGIRKRCDNKNAKGYEQYGGRGIKYDKSWKDNPEQFINDIENNLGKRPSKKHTLDRIDNNKGYYIENLRWADRTEQARNRRKATSTKHYCISEIHDNNYLVTILKDGYRRQSATMYTIDEAIKLRDLWEEEWEDDSDKWIQETINKSYTKHLPNHKYKNSTGYKCISERKGRFLVRVYKKKKCRATTKKTLENAIKIRDKWLLEYSNNPDKWIEDTINNTYKRE